MEVLESPATTVCPELAMWLCAAQQRMSEI